LQQRALIRRVNIDKHIGLYAIDCVSKYILGTYFNEPGKIRDTIAFDISDHNVGFFTICCWRTSIRIGATKFQSLFVVTLTAITTIEKHNDL
jgi:hypothetical protein